MAQGPSEGDDVSDNTADFAGALAALSRAIVSMEHRQGDLANQMGAVKQRRRECLDARVETLLPDISDATLARLRHEVPAFAADHKVMGAFEDKKKILWFFKPSGYNEVLAMLQAQLKLYSERRGFVSDEDQAIQRLQSEIHALASQHAEAQEMRKLIEVAHRTGSPLPPEAVRSINSFAQRGASLGGAVARQSAGGNRVADRSSRAIPDPPEHETMAVRQYETRAALEVWQWMMSGIPETFHSLMAGLVAHHLDSAARDASANPPVSGNGVVGGVEGLVPIATDDRLGAFS